MLSSLQDHWVREALARWSGCSSAPGVGCSLCGGRRTGPGSAARARGGPASAPPRPCRAGRPATPPRRRSSSWTTGRRVGVSCARSRPGEVPVRPGGEEVRQEVRARALARGASARTPAWNARGRGPSRGPCRRPGVGKRGRLSRPRARTAGRGARGGEGGRVSSWSAFVHCSRRAAVRPPRPRPEPPPRCGR